MAGSGGERTLESPRNEWLTMMTPRILQSIYPDCVSSDPSKGVKSLEIPIEFCEERTVLIVDDGTIASISLPEGQAPQTEQQTLSLSSLPPVLLQFILPETYPLSASPSIVSLHVTNSWLATTSPLQNMLEEMWQPGEGVLYTWVEWIRNADFLSVLHFLSEDVTGNEVVRCVRFTQIIVEGWLLTSLVQTSPSRATPARHTSHKQ